MENKTISYLNSKIWYRSLKVFYLFVFIIIIVSSVIITSFFVYSERNVDSEATKIKCYDGKIIKLKDTRVTLSSDYISDNADKQFKFACLTNEDLGSIVHNAYPSAYSDINNSKLGELVRNKADEYNRIYERISITTTNYTVTVAYERLDFFKLFGFIILIFLITSIFFELVRRSFYYIILGSIRPKK